MGGGILKNNNIVNYQSNNGLDFVKTLQSQKSIKNQNILKDISISKNQNVSKNIKTPRYIKILEYIKFSRYIKILKVLKSLKNSKTIDDQRDISISKDIKNSISNFFAFSLIELSIVLIIIGLLVAGVTGGQSLIKSAKIRAFMNELNSYRQATSSFYASKDRLPGDLNNLGTVGFESGQTYTTSSFSSPYNVKAPNEQSAPFIDLYLEKVIDFRPDPNDINTAGKGYPYSKVYKKSYYCFRNYISTGDPDFLTNFIKINSPYIFFGVNSADRSNIASDFKIVDQKMDDGLYNNGTIRSACYGSTKGLGFSSYDDAINKSGSTEQCTYLLYHMGF